MSKNLSYNIHSQAVAESIDTLVQRVIQLKTTIQSKGCPDYRAQQDISRFLRELEGTVTMVATVDVIANYGDDNVFSDVQQLLKQNEAHLGRLIEQYS